VTPITLVVPVVPVPKARPRTVTTKQGKRRTYTPETTVEAEDTIGRYWNQAYPHRAPWPRETALEVGVSVYLPKPKGIKRLWPTVRPDGDNYGKLALDSLNGLAWEDDAQVVRMVVEKRYDASPRWEIRICEFQG